MLRNRHARHQEGTPPPAGLPGWWLALCVASIAFVALSCNGGDSSSGEGTADAARGEQLFVEYGCATCHQVSGVAGAQGRVGPVLDGLIEQRVIAGVLPNTRGHLAAFIREPARYAPKTTMPDLGVTERDAEDIVEFLMSR